MVNLGSSQASNEPAGQTPYSAWLQTDALHSLQKTVSNHQGEFGFIVAAQMSELCWMLIVRELQAAQKQLRADNPTEASRTLRRVTAHFEPLNATWRSIAWLTPKDLLAMLSQVSAKHGACSVLQGWIYRHAVYLLGIKEAGHLQHFTTQPGRWEHLKTALAEPSIYDDVLAYFSRIGLTVPQHVLDRDLGAPYVPSQDVEQVWRDIYEDPYPDAPLQQLGETLMDIAQAFTDLKYRYLMTTRRSFEGVATLAPLVNELPFPELWSAQSHSGETG